MEAPQPYAPSKVVDPPAAPRAPASVIPFLWATFVFALSETGQLWQPLTGEHLRESFGPETDVGWFYLLAAAPGLLGLLWAYLSDRVSLMETRREGYVVLACLIAVATWAAAPFVPWARGPWLAISVALALAVALASTARSGAFVELARRHRAPGRLAAALAGLPALAQLVWFPVSRWLGGRPPGWWAVLAVVMASSVAALIIFVPGGEEPPQAEAVAGPSLGRYLRSRIFWSALAVVAGGTFVSSTVSNLATRNFENLSALTGRSLGLYFSLGHLAGAAGYLLWCRRGNLLRSLLAFTVLEMAGALVGGAVVGDRAPAAACVLVATLGRLSLAARLDLALRAAPRRREAFGMEALVSPLPLLPFGTIIRMEFLHGTPRTAAITLGVLWLLVLAAILLVPRRLLTPRDGDAVDPA